MTTAVQFHPVLPGMIPHAPKVEAQAEWDDPQWRRLETVDSAQADPLSSAETSSFETFICLLALIVKTLQISQTTAKQRSAGFSILAQEQNNQRKEETISSANKELGAAFLSLGAIAGMSAMGGLSQYKGTVNRQESVSLRGELEQSARKATLPASSPEREMPVMNGSPFSTQQADDIALLSSGRQPSQSSAVRPMDELDNALSSRSPVSGGQPSGANASADRTGQFVHAQRDADGAPPTAAAPSTPSVSATSASEPASTPTLSDAQREDMLQRADQLELSAARYGASGSAFSTCAMAAGHVLGSGMQIAAAQDRANSEMSRTAAENTTAVNASLSDDSRVTRDASGRCISTIAEALRSSERVGQAVAGHM